MTNHLCYYHKNNLDLKGIKMGEAKNLDEYIPEVACKVCREKNYCDESEIRIYETFQLVDYYDKLID